MIASFIALLVLAFFIGSVPSGYIVGQIYGIDLRKQGSGNTGATNAGRVLGKKAGTTTLVADVIKGFIALWLASVFPVELSFLEKRELQALLGFTALVGHCYSPFLKFQGGKGVATGAGVFLSLAPFQTALALAIFAATLKWKRYVSLSSMLGAVAVPVLLLLSPDRADRKLAIFAAASAALIVYRHQANIARLKAGTEPRYGRSR